MADYESVFALSNRPIGLLFSDTLLSNFSKDLP